MSSISSTRGSDKTFRQRVFGTRGREAIAFYLFILPWLVGFAAFTLYPLVLSFYYSFTRFNLSSPPKWIGLDNYSQLLNDPLFWQSLKVTASYTLFALPLGLAFSLGVAVMLNQRVPFLAFFRTIYFLPTVISGVAVALLWQLLLSPDFGIVNFFIKQLSGWDGPRWFIDPDWTIPGYVLISLWGIGGSMIIYLAGLQGVPTHLYEAAELDGAGPVRRFFAITLPMISPVILFTFITGLISSFNVFENFYVLSDRRGAPSNSALSYVLNLFNQGFSALRMGYSSAMGWILFIIVLLLTILFLRLARSMVYYEAPDA